MNGWECENEWIWWLTRNFVNKWRMALTFNKCISHAWKKGVFPKMKTVLLIYLLPNFSAQRFVLIVASDLFLCNELQ
jgi:hypothetical protein